MTSSTWKKSARCTSTNCLEATRDSTSGVVLLRDSAFPESPPVPFTEIEWVHFLNVVESDTPIAWLIAGFRVTTGLDTSDADFEAFQAGVRDHEFEFEDLPHIDGG